MKHYLFMVVAAFLLAACGGGGVPSGTPAAPTVSISAASTNLSSGGSTTLTWSSANATSCTASGGWSGTLATSGTQSTGALTANTTYSLICSGAGGNSTAATATVTVTAPASPLPTATLAASPASLASGAASTLTWNSTNATACTASGGWTGVLATSGTQSTAALTATTGYSLTCTGTGGTSPVAAATVTVVPVPTVTLTAPPNPVANGHTSTLTWTSTYATGCTASASWSGTKAISGTVTTAPVSSNSLFTLTCTGIGGTSVPANVTVNVVPTAMLTAYPTAVPSGGTSLLTWSSSNATACTGSGPSGWAGPLTTANGTEATAALTATTTYGLICGGAGGMSSLASATVTIATGTLALSPSHAELTVSQTQQFTATVPGGGTATWTVGGYGSGNASVGTINSSGLYTAGTTAGNYSIVATAGADSATAPVAVTDLGGVYTYHNDLSRDGSNTQEYALNTSNVNTTSFGKLASCSVDGAISAQPLWVANLTVGSARHNVVFVATQNDSVYAFDADASACTVLWQANLIDTAHGGTSGEVAVPYSLVGAGHGDIQPIIGVTGTPVIDPTSGIMYVVSKSVTPATSSGTFYTRLHALDILTGNEESGAPAVIRGSFTGNTHTATFVTQQELQRPGLALVNGSVYVGFGAHEDQSPFYGWMMSYKFVGGTLSRTYIVNVAPDAYKAGIWMSGGAPAADSSNNIYAITGNGAFDVTSGTATTDDYGDSLVQFSPSLQVTQYFTPSDESGDNTNDVDYGAGGAALLADLPAGNVVTHALVTAGKDGILYVLNRDSLGGLGTNNAVQAIGFGFPLFATGAAWNDNFYIGGSGGPINFYHVNTANAQLTKTTYTAHNYGYGGTSPSVSASATQNGIVWSMDETNFCMGDKSHTCGAAVLLAHDATNAKTQLWTSSDASNNVDVAGNAIKFNVPTVANGRVYVGTGGNYNPQGSATPTVMGELDIYGLKP